MKLRAFFVLAALALASTTAAAETVCNNCVYTFPGTYLGPHWKGDQSTINSPIGSPIAPIDHLFVLDANENGTLSLTVPGQRISVYVDVGSICPPASFPCEQVVVGPQVASKVRKLRVGIVAGRYVIRIEGPAGSPRYAGTVALTRP